MYNNNSLMTLLLFGLPFTIFLILFCGCVRTWSTSDEEEEEQYLLNKKRHQKLE